MKSTYEESGEPTEMRAEVSGWDRAGGYFVERVVIHIERRGMALDVPRAMAPRSVLFVRRLLEDGSVEPKSEILHVVRCQKNQPGGYRVRCRLANPRRETKGMAARRLRFSNHFSNRGFSGSQQAAGHVLCHSSHGAKPPII